MKTVIRYTSFVALMLLAACSSSQDAAPAKSSAKPKSSSTAAKGSGSNSASSAKQTSQKTGSTAASSTGSSTMQDESQDGVVCDGTLEGVGFCASETDLVFCSSGSWYSLSCSSLDEFAFCGLEVDTGTVDCWLAVDEE